MIRRHRVAIAVFAFCAALACQMGPTHPPAWADIEVAAPSENILWAVASQELQRLGFPLGVDADPRMLVMRSAWKTELAPFKGEGQRRRAEVRIEVRAAGLYGIESRVEKEINHDMVRPLDPSHAAWKSAPDDFETARLLLSRIKARLGGGKIDIGERKPSFPAK